METPLLASATIPDPNLHSLSTTLHLPQQPQPRRLYLQTSPEFAMKRLLAAGSGPIFQICKAFRDQEAGTIHNPEFTLLEWYRPGLDHHHLMDEVDELLHALLDRPPAERLTYRAAFRRHLDLDPFTAPLATLVRASRDLGLASELDRRDDYLALLMTHAVEPHLGRRRPTLVYDYPAAQAALARIRPEPSPVAERFELYLDGIELANGFHELADAEEQRRRFAAELDERRHRGLEPVPIDEYLLAALDHGLPSCSGVALGIDRLLMIRLGAASLRAVLPFSVDRV